MTVLLNADVNGDGSTSLASTGIEYALISVYTEGDLTEHPWHQPPDRLLRCGWLAFGFRSSDVGGSPVDYWLPPIWFDYQTQLWLPEPSTNPGGSAFSLMIDQVRWHFQGAGTGNIYIVGP